MVATWGVFSSYGGGSHYNFLCSAMSGILSSYDGHLRNLNYAWQDNTDASGGEVGDRGSLSSWNTDIGVPIHFQKESGIVTF